MARTRQLLIPRQGGTAMLIATGTKNSYSSNESWDDCEDIVGNFRGQNPCSIHHARTSECYLNGIGGGYLHENCPVSCTNAHTHQTISHSGWTPKYSRSVSQAMAATHPGEPHLSLPNFLFELKDVPGMLKHALSKLKPPRNKRHLTARELANDHLQYAFGWAPLLSDLRKIGDVSKWTYSRAKMIMRARTLGFVSRTGQRGQHTQSFVENNYPYNTNGVGISGVCRTECSSKAWVSTRWRYIGTLPIGSSLDEARHGLKFAAYGMDLSFENIWNAIPWSWMVDYFTDLSSIVSLHQNRAGFKFTGGCAMESKMIQQEVTPKRYSDIGAVKVVIMRERKTRTLANPSIFDAGLNFLRPKQLANLAALGVTRLGR